MTKRAPHWSRGWFRYAPKNRRREIAFDRRVRRKAARLGLHIEKSRTVGGWTICDGISGLILEGPGLFDWQLEDELNARLAAREAVR
ncbi:hypothetical protein [Martelella sp. FOR1707]